MGPSGSGKSTLLALLTGQHAVQSGRIEIDGQPLSDLSMESLRRLIMLNPQEPYFFDWSIAENIRLFQSVSEKTILELLERVGLKEKIDSLSKGIHSGFGENGCEFSGGEKQRVGIVRALLRKPQILFIDTERALKKFNGKDTESEWLDIIISLTENCNLHCKYCYENDFFSISNNMLKVWKEMKIIKDISIDMVTRCGPKWAKACTEIVRGN